MLGIFLGSRYLVQAVNVLFWLVLVLQFFGNAKYWMSPAYLPMQCFWSIITKMEIAKIYSEANNSSKSILVILFHFVWIWKWTFSLNRKHNECQIIIYFELLLHCYLKVNLSFVHVQWTWILHKVEDFLPCPMWHHWVPEQPVKQYVRRWLKGIIMLPVLNISLGKFKLH